MELILQPTKLDYFDGKHLLADDTFRISASGVGKFFTQTTTWWRDNLLGENSFTSNSASIAGSMVHYVCEQYAKKQSLSAEDREQLDLYVTKHTNPAYSDYNEDIDKAYVEEQYKAMAQALINEYVAYNLPTFVEPFITHELLPGVVTGGSIDSLTLNNPVYNGDPVFENLVSAEGGTIVDYKTKGVWSSSLPKPGAKMDFVYRLQLLTYAWILRQRGIMVDRIRLVYVSKQELDRYGKPNAKGICKKLPDYLSKTSVQTEQLTEETMEYIEGILRLIADSVHTWNTMPSMRYLLAMDYRLKESNNVNS